MRELFEAGVIVDDRYEIVCLVGSGGMGTVYKALELELGRMVALKVLASDWAEDPDARARFDREGRIISSLSHANVAIFYRFAIWLGKYPYMAMEYVEGPTLRRLLDEKGSLGVDQVIEVGIQICAALDHAHRLGVVHRDVKPGNIIVVEEAGSPYVKLVDFGLARAALSEQGELQRLTQTGMLLGSVQYMSPEQCLGKQADSRSDLYSLGCVLYECIAGTTPLRAENPIILLHKHINEIPPLVSELKATVPAGLDAVLARALQKDPSRRYAAAAEMRDDLLRVQRAEGHLLASGLAESFERRKKSCLGLMRSRWTLLLGGASLVALFLVAGDKEILSGASESLLKLSGNQGPGRRVALAERLAGLGMSAAALSVLGEFGQGAGKEAAPPSKGEFDLGLVGRAYRLRAELSGGDAAVRSYCFLLLRLIGAPRSPDRHRESLVVAGCMSQTDARELLASVQRILSRRRGRYRLDNLELRIANASGPATVQVGGPTAEKFLKFLLDGAREGSEYQGRVLVNQGRLYDMERQWELARGCYRRAISVLRRYPSSISYLGNAYNGLFRVNVTLKDLPAAHACLESGKRNLGRWVWMLTKEVPVLAEADLEAGDSDNFEKISHYALSSPLAHNPDKIRSAALLWRFYLSRHRRPEAQTVQRALLNVAERTDMEPAHRRLAVPVFFEQGLYDECLRQISLIGPAKPEDLRLEVETLIGAKRYGEAQAKIEKLRRWSPNIATSLDASMLIGKGDLSGAHRIIDPVVRAYLAAGAPGRDGSATAAFGPGPGDDDDEAQAERRESSPAGEKKPSLDSPIWSMLAARLALAEGRRTEAERYAWLAARQLTPEHWLYLPVKQLLERASPRGGRIGRSSS